MALFKSATMTQASGSVGGLTYTRSNQGMIMRSRGMPTNPNTPRQICARNALRNASIQWKEELTDAQRAAWELYALNVTLTNRLGDAINVSGQNMYIRSRSIWAQLNDPLGFVDNLAATAPSEFNIGTVNNGTANSYETGSGGTGITVELPTIGNGWRNNPGSYLLLFQGKPCNPTRRYFRGPWRLIAAVAGSTTTPPTTIIAGPSAIAQFGYPAEPGQCVNLAIAAITVDNRYTGKRQIPPVIAFS
jgi:hypothetical protein